MVTNFPEFNPENVMAAFCSHLLISEFHHVVFDLRFDCVCAHSHPCMD